MRNVVSTRRTAKVRTTAANTRLELPCRTKRGGRLLQGAVARAVDKTCLFRVNGIVARHSCRQGGGVRNFGEL